MLDMRNLIIIDFNRTIFDPDSNKIFDGVLEFLSKYQIKYDLALIGKGEGERKDLLDSLDILKYFKFVKIEPEKKPEFFLECLNHFKIEPKEAWSIGDRIKKEIVISKKLGIKTIWFRNGKFKDEIPANKDEEPDYIIQTFKEIENIIHL
jgi:FMN phosphatase YigB (HAD superfamily)